MADDTIKSQTYSIFNYRLSGFDLIIFLVYMITFSLHNLIIIIVLADRVGFEPTDRLWSLVFKTSALDHSATYPF